MNEEHRGFAGKGVQPGAGKGVQAGVGGQARGYAMGSGRQGGLGKRGQAGKGVQARGCRQVGVIISVVSPIPYSLTTRAVSWFL